MLERMLDTNEQVVWKGKPKRWIYTLGSPMMYVIAAFWLLFDVFFFQRFMSISSFFDRKNSSFFFMITFIILHLTPVWIAIFGPIYRFFAWRSVEYIVTTRRVYLQSGLIGKDITSLGLYEIQNLTVNVGALEKMGNCGTVRLTPDYSTGTGDNRTTRHGYRMLHIDQPYEVYNLIKKLALDVSTDKSFPNAYRPSENPGYPTNPPGDSY